jgi:hypothetical protein
MMVSIPILEKNNNVALIIFAVFFGLFLAIVPGIIFCILITLYFFRKIYASLETGDRFYVISALGLALFLRFGIIFLLQIFCLKNGILDLFGDAGDNIYRGNLLSLFVSGESFYPPFDVFHTYNVHAKTFFNSMFLAYFNKDIMSLKYVNIFFVIIGGYLLFDLTKRIHSSVAGKIAMTIFLFWPTIFLWSITDLKESHLINGLVLLFWIANFLSLGYRFRTRIFALAGFILCSLYVIFLKPLSISPVFLILFIFLLMYYLLRLGKSDKLWKRYFSRLVILAIVLLVIHLHDIFTNVLISSYDRIISVNRGFLNSGGWNYDLLGDGHNYYSFAFIIKFILGGWFHFLFEPFLGSFNSWKMLVFYPFVIIWYSMIFISFLGLVQVFRSGLIKKLIVPLLFSVIFITLIGMSIPNIGTLMRFRDVILPVMAILSAIYLASIFNIQRTD